jgi:hypothetical protein
LRERSVENQERSMSISHTPAGSRQCLVAEEQRIFLLLSAKKFQED